MTAPRTFREFGETSQLCASIPDPLLQLYKHLILPCMQSKPQSLKHPKITFWLRVFEINRRGRTNKAFRDAHSLVSLQFCHRPAGKPNEFSGKLCLEMLFSFLLLQFGTLLTDSVFLQTRTSWHNALPAFTGFSSKSVPQVRNRWTMSTF